MRLLRRLRDDEAGFALLLALGAMIALTISLIAVISYTNSNSRSADIGKSQNSASAIAEAGVNAAVSILNVQNSADPTVLGSSTSTICISVLATCPSTSSVGVAGTANVWGSMTIVDTIYKWTITSTGYAYNAQTHRPLSKTLVADVRVRLDPTQPSPNVTAWNYEFAQKPMSTSCDVTLDQSGQIAASLYVAGNLCFKNSAGITELTSTAPVSLEVLGRLVWLSGSSKGVGDSSTSPKQYVSTAKIGGGCASTANPAQGASHTCDPNGPSRDYFYVKSGGYSSSAPVITAPTPDYSSEYASASPGPHNVCSGSASTRLANTTWDSEGTPDANDVPNNSVATAFNLTPSTSYTCTTVDDVGNVVGALSWDATNHRLTVRGTAYIDGSAFASNGAVNSYYGVNRQGVHTSGTADAVGGSATIYLSGTFTLSSNTQICGWDTTHDAAAVTSGACDYSKWTPNSSMLVIVAKGMGASGSAISLSNGAYFQGGLFSAGDISLGQSSQLDGPLIGQGLNIGQSVKMRPFPTITDLPIGAPGAPNAHATPDPPVYRNG